ncbi:hypothetical protein BDZ91DRAFT_747728 [Kalaharituber pfeilii]|nr:hypothetical protein BDZ91DRAFT_747728 [Kalaharituber pfeilii]
MSMIPQLTLLPCCVNAATRESTTHLTAVLRECRHVGCILPYIRVSQAVEVSSCRAAIHEKLAISGARRVSE